VRAVAADLLYSETERDLAAALSDLLGRAAAPADVLARTEQPETYDAKLWRTVAAEIGIAGLLIPEPLGGAGASYRELAAAAEQFGAAVAPIPYLGSAAVATAALLSAARSAAAADAESAEQAAAAPWASGEGLSGPAAFARAAALRAQAQASSAGSTRTAPVSPAAGLLRQLADGSLTAVLAVTATAAPRGPFPAAVRVSGRGPAGGAGIGRDGAGEGTVKLRGMVKAVADALPAGALLVPAEGVPNGLYLVEATAPGVHRIPVVSLDMTRQLCDISFDDAEARQIVVGPGAAAAVDAGLAAGAAVLAAEQLGLAQRCLDLTVAYVKERRQFARPVGSFQALKHRLADLWTTITLARAASRYAAACLADDDPDAPVAIALAKSACCEAAVLAAEEMVQLHGGIGFTWEHPAHLYLKRAKAASVTFGTPGAHLAALATLVDLPAPGALPLVLAVSVVLVVLVVRPIGVGARVGPLRPVGVTAALGGHGVPSGRRRLGRQVGPGRRVRLAAGLGIGDSAGARLGAARRRLLGRLVISRGVVVGRRVVIGPRPGVPAPRRGGFRCQLRLRLRLRLTGLPSLARNRRRGHTGPAERRPGRAHPPLTAHAGLVAVGDVDPDKPDRQADHRHGDDHPDTESRLRRPHRFDHSWPPNQHHPPGYLPISPTEAPPPCASPSSPVVRLALSGRRYRPRGHCDERLHDLAWRQDTSGPAGRSRAASGHVTAM
jgi:alkylation response protein AidB-like acyl-CoA dehydrogenase